MNPEKVGDTAVILGGGLVGVELSIYLSMLGRKVTIVEMLDNIAADVEGGILPSLLKLVEKYGITVMTGTKVTGVDGNDVTVEKDGVTQTLPFDQVVLALGLMPNNSIAEELKGIVETVVVAGDARVIKKALEATRDGFVAGLSV